MVQTSTYQQNYELLLQKLRDFKRKYYRNEILKGGLYFTAIFLLSFLVVNALEYFGRFDTTTRTVLFYAFILANGYILTRYIIFPLLSLYELRKNLSYDQAASIIGTHFTEVKDKLLNTLQLHSQAQGQNGLHKDLIEASINQKINELKPVPFVRAVDYNTNRKYIRYAAIPLGILLIVLLGAPNMLLESTERLVKHDTYFEEKAPFQFILKNDSLTGVRQQDFTVNLKIKGEELPAEVFLVVDGNPVRMTADSKTEFKYTLKNLQKNLSLQFNANGFTSRPYDLKVLPKPSLQKFEVKLVYPGYLGKKEEILQNVGDLTIPAGTTVSWKFFTENTDQIQLAFKDKLIPAERKGENTYTFQNRFLQDDSYFLKTANKYLQSADSIQYMVNVVADAYPSIRVESEQDSMHLKNLYFTGEITDDYGFRNLQFKYRFIKSDDSAKMRRPEQRQNLPIAQGKFLQSFYHFWDLGSLNINAGDEIEYYFEVWDNDGVNGSKSARSQKLFFKAPSLNEIEKNAEANNKALENKMESAIKDAAKLQKQMTDMRLKLMDKKNMDWQDKKQIDDILKKQKELENKVDEIKKDYSKNLQQQTEFKEINKELLEKHQEMQKMLEDIMDEETKKMLEELQKLLEENNKDEIQKQLDEMKFNDKEVQKELDRMQELFKQLQFEQKLEETTEKLEKLSEEQDKLAKEAEQKDAKSEELEKKQEELNKEFEDVKKDLEELEKKNEELENKNEMEKTDEEEKDIEQDMEKSQENLENKQNSKAAQNQKKAAQKMKKLSEKLKKMQSDMANEAAGEDLQAIRQLLENLVYVSVEQEKLMNEFKTVNTYNPQYVELAQRQRKLKDDAKIIEDSLLALSKRVMQIKSFVNKEIGEINFNMDKSLESFAARNTARGRAHQQFTMTSLNNLALMLSESMENMQEQMKEQKNCNGPDCKGKPKPKKGQGKSMSKMREMQEQLNHQLQQMKNGMKQGKEGKGSNNTMSQEMAKMAAQQEMLRRQLQKLNEENNKDGKNSLGDLQKIQDMMDKTEEDLVNKRITDETIKRQQDILVRMLDAEKAEKQQDFEDKREATSGQDKKNGNPPMLEKYLRMKEKEVELLRTVPPALNPYYREKVKEYFQGIR
ncbi:MAG: DUF4175 family protein [Bacteroidia bacterium]